MDSKKIKNLLASVKDGNISIEDALKKLKHLPYEDISFAKVDHHRHLRQGVPEVIYASGKTEKQVMSIARAMHGKSRSFLITKATKKLYTSLGIKGAVFYPAAGIIAVGEEKKKTGNILMLTAGTSDIPVAEEAAVTASFLGSKVETAYDVGVAGLHRLMDASDEMRKARVIVVAAGMEGALPSVVGGMTDKPIIAVPTSTGYGTSLGGLTALFAMLNSCVPGIAVMNIDNGFGAGCLAHKINTLGNGD
ncbi:MAG: nickel pincer cofactor biosynthesis protein LarB [Nitrospiraceae bacterium]|jgi:pyridinium-3,5-biscarboxylic acid mononucleotide synthase|nr:MAG: nickel pincer cofactor biosynthesis protein LarB [Nitrospiraceae bacterium]